MTRIREAKKVAVVGIRGSGMLALAQILHDWGIEVEGYDHEEGQLELTPGTIGTSRTSGTTSGTPINVSTFDKLAQSKADLVIASSAHLERDELAWHRQQEKFLSYQAAVAQIFEERFGIAIAGTHGKTTSAAMTAFLLTEMGITPTALVGGQVINYQRNGWSGPFNQNVLGSSLRSPDPIFVAEVDEYQDKFNMYAPRLSLITNVEYEHPDFFRSRDSYLEVFTRFVDRTLQNHGLAVLNIDSPFLLELAGRYPGRVVTVGFNERAEWRIRKTWKKGCASHFEAEKSGRIYRFSLKIPGAHNVSNALGAAAVTFMVCQGQSGLPSQEFGLIRRLAKVLSRFEGVKRRIEYLGFWQGQVVYDDYGHHHTQVKRVIETLRTCHPDKPINLVFEPHTVSRTRVFQTELVSALAAADRVILLPVYQAYRDPGQSFDIYGLGAALANLTTVSCASGFEEVYYQLSQIRDRGVLIIMGAGEIGNLWPYLKGRNREQEAAGSATQSLGHGLYSTWLFHYGCRPWDVQK